MTMQFNLGRLSTGVSFITLRERFSWRLVFAKLILCALIFWNFAVYWQICENLSPWKLLFLSMKINPFKVFFSLFSRVVVILKQNDSTVWKCETRIILVYQPWQYSAIWHSICKHYILSNHENNVHANLLQFHDLGKINDARYPKISIHQNEFTWKLNS